MQRAAFEEKYMRQLNPRQREAVEAVDGPVLLLATPGSGKTTVLVTRLGYMALCRDIAPESILTMTYTRAATGDMRSRFANLFGPALAERLEFRTINGVSARIIDYFGTNHARRRPFELLESEGELNRVVRKLIQELSGEYPDDSAVREARSKITYIKNMLLTDAEIDKLESEVDHLPEIYRRYQKTLREARRMDYDDQMIYALNILQRYPEALSYFQQRYPYLCVDEAQDTSKVQHEIIKTLCRGSENLFMVGDEDQSIYGFRAAYPDALLNFEADHPGARVLLIQENYRSTPQIVAAANRFIVENAFRREKVIEPTRPDGAPVHLIRCQDREAQFRYITAAAERNDGEIAVLFRNNDSALPLIDRFERRGIAYTCRNFEDVFFTHRVVTDIADTLRLAHAPNDAERFLHIYYKYGMGINKEQATGAARLCQQTGEGVVAALLRADLKPQQRAQVLQFAEGLKMLPKDDATTALTRVWQYMGYGRYVEQRGLDAGKYFILGQLADALPDALALLNRLDALREAVRIHASPRSGGVILSTVHSSKGLEYDSVYLLDALDGIWPSVLLKPRPTDAELREYEEERRLYYVAMTRARDDLYLFDCRTPAKFTEEVMKRLPRPVADESDCLAALIRPQIGMTYADAVRGQGRIAAQCDDWRLIEFRDGDALLTLPEMVGRRALTYVAPKPEAPRGGQHHPKTEKAFPDKRRPIWSEATLDAMGKGLKPGDAVEHTLFGEGTVIDLRGDIFAVYFADGKTRKFSLGLIRKR